MSGYEIHKVNTGNYNTFFCEGGKENKETIVFLHGSGPGANSVSNWHNIIPELTDRFHVIAPDYYGFGKTDHPKEPPTDLLVWTNHRVNQIIELMDYLKVDKFHLVGNSMGGYISLNLVMTVPERIEKVVLMGSPGGTAELTPELARMTGFYRNPTYTNLKNITKWFVYDQKSLGDDLEFILKERYENVMNPDFKRSYTNARVMNPYDVQIPPNALKLMEQPFLLIHGMEDRFILKESSLSMMEHLPNAQLHLIKGCGHWVQIEKKGLFIHLVREFFLGNMQ